MDPVSIATAVVGLTATCLTTCKKLSDLAPSYGDVPVMIAMICSESTVISIALSELQMKILRRDDLSQAWASKNEIQVVFETVLTACMTVFSCLEAETRRLESQNPGVWAKLKFMWSQDRLKDLLNALRGQQTSIASVTEAQSLRSRNPSIQTQSRSIFDNDISKLSLFDIEAVSAIAPSELDFEFDDLVLNSQAYRRAFARAQAEREQPERHVVEGDLIDLFENTIDNSDAATIREIHQDLKDLILGPISNTQRSTSGSKSPSNSIAGRNETDESLQLQKRNLWDEPDTNFCTRETECQSNQGKESGLQPQISPQRNFRTFRECSGCSEPLTSEYVKLLDAFWHVSCITCADCGDAIITEVFPLNAEDKGRQQLLCETDYFKRLDLLCFACGKAVGETYVSVGDRRYHQDHFKCDECDNLLGDQDSYYEHEGRLYCCLDYCRNYAKRCDFCKFPILAQNATSYRQDPISKAAHPTCAFMREAWNITLPLTLQGREDSTFSNCDILRMQKEHESCIERVHQVTSTFLDAFREELANTSNACIGGRHTEAFEHYQLVIALTSVVLKAASEAREGASSDYQMNLLSWALHLYLKAAFSRTSSNIDIVVEFLKPRLKLVLETNYRRSRAAGSRFDKFLVNLSATKPPALRLPYTSEPSSEDKPGMRCERCHLYVRHRACSALSTPDLRWHPHCWKCEKCGWLAPIGPKSQNEIQRSEYKCISCGYEGSFMHIPDYVQFVYIMWQAWGHVAVLDCNK
ncbi:hypothetical protein FDECE_5855 [Fusarium decemcellulare]|nr:hypothetical protein FDECE_5855 [Fusarium decemcellulare]